MKRKYHSGLMPAGAETNGSALTPRFHGKSAARAPSAPMATYQAIISRSMKLGKNFISRRAAGIGGPLRFDLGRNTHALPLHQEQVNGDEHGDDAGQNSDMESEEAGQRGARDFFAAAQKDHHGLADDGNLSGDLRSDLGGEEGQRVPGQQVAAEAESHDQKEQQHARDPGELSGLAIRLEKNAR